VPGDRARLKGFGDPCAPRGAPQIIVGAPIVLMMNSHCLCVKSAGESSATPSTALLSSDLAVVPNL
jgi:hypothetical protein